ncbi:hypothetical protein [Candidatus Magnetobacterium casense]|uniref:Uncharacterized protein n=1 Tax=Candidatus Magnetobacterium casense TaxID=1455061 RepID=A0ABS6RU17_9BACT|nr:hypothetical protein [Candidatus Magnetobacterium casensis]MBV6340116.1 hypothetical protein [Candidatus Magnetobacterium casensis]
MKTDKTYKIEYDIFMKSYKRGTTDGEEVGRMVARMAQFFAEKNTQLADAINAYAIKAAEISNSTDESGKGIAVNKANILADASEEAALKEELEADLKNIEQYLNALKSLQKGIMNEYSHMGNI